MLLIYLDAMVAQYIADNLEYIMYLAGFRGPDEFDYNRIPRRDPKYMIEIEALGQLFLLEQLGNDWWFAVTPHLLDEVYAGQPTQNQVQFYKLLADAWNECSMDELYPLDNKEVERVEQTLVPLGLKHSADRLHLAQATVLNASWFLTNDSEVLSKCRKAQLPLRVCRPSECLEGISVGLFLRTE